VSHHVSSNFTISKGPNLPSLPIDEQQRQILCDMLYQQILYGFFTFPEFSEKNASFVQYSIARYKGQWNTEPVMDEPLVILAAMRFLHQQQKNWTFNYLRLEIHDHSSRRNGLEGYLVYYLREVFTNAKKLDTIFTLRHDFHRLAWQHEEFELVTVVNANQDKPQVSVVTPTSGPSSHVGLRANSGEEVVQWITTNDDQNTFLFPPESFGPDILFFLQHKESGHLLLVMLHAKMCKDVKRATLMQGIRSVTPSWSWKRKYMQVCRFQQTICIFSD